MGGLIIACIILAAACLILLIRSFVLNQRIRKLAEQVDGFNSGTAQMLDVALEEDRLARLHNGIADLQLSLTRAKQLNTEECNRTSQLTADISHQLKTPLTTLRLYTELDEAPHMEASLEQIQRMENLIQALLRLERLCADGYAFNFAPADAETIIQEQWQSLQAIWPDKKLVIEGSAHIRCDENWLGEAFLNLLKNACEHTSDEGVIRVQLERTEAAFFCIIEDNGGGVAPAVPAVLPGAAPEQERCRYWSCHRERDYPAPPWQHCCREWQAWSENDHLYAHVGPQPYEFVR